ncbi:hypothetical protein [Amycolatopsis sp. NPDC003676]
MAPSPADSVDSGQLLDQLEFLELRFDSHAHLAGSDLTDPGTSDWWATAGMTVSPDEDDPADQWYFSENATLSAKPDPQGYVDVSILEASGLTVDLQHVDGIFDALDARSPDYAKFIPLFGNRDEYGFLGLDDRLQSTPHAFGTHVVIVDRVRLAPAWRGLGGIGRLLTARVLRWICSDPRLIAVQPFPIDLDRSLLRHASVFEPALDKVRRTWASLGFVPAFGGTWVADPGRSAYSNAVEALERKFGLR